MRVLVADDSPTIRAVLRASLTGWGFDVVEATNGEEAWNRLQEADAPSLALIDWEMPNIEGVELCRRVRAREAAGAPYTYVLLLTARRARHDIVAGMEAGADDYVVKPFDQHELRVRLRAGRRIVDLQAELYRLQEMFRAQSRTDPLTGCLNRRGITERLLAEISFAQRDRRPLGVAVLDMDHFKRINDTHGHTVGDAVLQELVRRVTASTRASDSFGRIGGEEFLILWPGLSGESSRVAADRVRQMVERTPFHVDDVVLSATVSLGVTTTMGDDTQETIIERADQALYAAKAAGRNRVVLA
ncbi:MAG TPA: diguanylate cyclase [Anaeromyxobacter sp.]|nr:diguanylate cyclase [Anaeromyxobacter sp.]